MPHHIAPAEGRFGLGPAPVATLPIHSEEDLPVTPRKVEQEERTPGVVVHMVRLLEAAFRDRVADPPLQEEVHSTVPQEPEEHQEAWKEGEQEERRQEQELRSMVAVA